MAFPGRHWSGLFNLHLTPYDKSKANWAISWSDWLSCDGILTSRWRRLEEVSPPKRESQKEVLCCPLTSQRMRQTPRWQRDGKNMGLCWLKALIQSTLKLTLQQDSHFCGDHKFSYCVSRLSWVSITCSWKHPHWWTILKKNDSWRNNPPSFWLTLASRDNYLGHQIRKKYGGHQIKIRVRERVGIVTRREFWEGLLEC